MGHRPGSPRTTPPPGTDRTTQPRGFVGSVVDVAPKLFLPLPADRLPERFARCIFGLALFGLGSAMFFASELGAAPWDVFHQGIAHHTGLPVGLIIQLTGLLIVAMWYPLGLRPGWGTLLNATEIGLVVMLVGDAAPDVRVVVPAWWLPRRWSALRRHRYGVLHRRRARHRSA